jgi:signal transduction histidine kinase
VVDLLRFNGKIRYQTKGGWWSSKKARVVKDDGASENYVGRKFIEELKRQGAALQAKEAGWMIVETANIKAEDGIEKCQRVKLKLRLGASYVYEGEFTIYDVKGFNIVLGKR